MALRARVLVRDGSEVRSNFRIDPYAGLLVMGDYELTNASPFDAVQTVTPSAHHLDALTVRKGGGSLLDLGVGSGVQSLRAASHTEHVVGVDLNPRALAFSRFNAVLNGVENLELRLGSTARAGRRERFDLVLATPSVHHLAGPRRAVSQRR